MLSNGSELQITGIFHPQTHPPPSASRKLPKPPPSLGLPDPGAANGRGLPVRLAGRRGCLVPRFDPGP